MKIRQCRNPGCSEFFEIKIGTGYYCDKHKDADKERYKEYKRQRTDNNAFYSTKAWIKVRNDRRNHFFGLCIKCLIKEGKQEEDRNILVHHIETVEENESLKLDKDNLICLCSSCHSSVHKIYEEGQAQAFKEKKYLHELVDKFNNIYHNNNPKMF